MFIFLCKMKKTFYNFRCIRWMAIICSLFASLLLLFTGTIQTYCAYNALYMAVYPKTTLPHLGSSGSAITYLIESFDTFLIALLLLTFSCSIFTLFGFDKKIEKKFGRLSWIRTPNLGHIKNVLADVILIILFVKFVEIVLMEPNSLTLEGLMLRVFIFILAFGLNAFQYDHKRAMGIKVTIDGHCKCRIFGQ